ncbi:uncharacterized protein GBIM_16232 [Gryllus bimaculatus]|nr:uncharacterized protein GBIM_16232 [Gryllus bimaculatus]
MAAPTQALIGEIAKSTNCVPAGSEYQPADILVSRRWVRIKAKNHVRDLPRYARCLPRVFKKSSPNSKLTLYLSNRDLSVTGDYIDKLQGVVLARRYRRGRWDSVAVRWSGLGRPAGHGIRAWGFTHHRPPRRPPPPAALPRADEAVVREQNPRRQRCQGPSLPTSGVEWSPSTLTRDPRCARVWLQVFGQVTLTFRYGREDEEVMGLKFCNEAVMSLAQLYPPPPIDLCAPPTPLQIRILLLFQLLVIVLFLLLSVLYPPPPIDICAPPTPLQVSTFAFFIRNRLLFHLLLLIVLLLSVLYPPPPIDICAPLTHLQETSTISSPSRHRPPPPSVAALPSAAHRPLRSIHASPVYDRDLKTRLLFPVSDSCCMSFTICRERGAIAIKF